MLVAVLIITTALGLAWRRRQGRLRAVGATGRPARHLYGSAPAGSAADAAGQPTLTAADLQHELGPRATLVQFSSAFCAPCRATRQILGADPAAKVLILSAHSDDEYIERMTAAGVAGFLEKQTSAEILT